MTSSPNATLNIGVLLPGLGVFGGVRRFIEIGNEMVRRGHRFTLYHPTGEPPDWLPFSGDVQSSDAIQHADHDVLICNDPPLMPAFERASARLKLFYFALEGIPNERRIARHPGWVIVANSGGMADHLERRHGVKAERAIGGIGLDTFKPPDSPQRDPDRYRIMAFGRMSRRRKGVPIVVRAVESFAHSMRRRGGPTVTLVLFDHVGQGNEQDPREDLSATVPIEFHLNLSQPELAALYGSCDLFVSAEKRAGWSNTVAEAMACGLPVVCTRSGTLDLAVHMESAWVARWRHSFFLSRGIRQMQGDPELAQRLAAAAHRSMQRFSWPRVTDQLEDVIRRNLP